MKAKDVMTHPVISITPDTEVSEVAKILLENRISAVPVIDEQQGLTGIVSEGDLFRHATAGTEQKRPRSWWLSMVSDPKAQAKDYTKHHGRFAHEIMTSKVVTVSKDTALPEIAALLEEHGIKRVLVLDKGDVVGVVSRANLLHGIATAKPTTTSSLDDNSLRATINSAIDDAGIRNTYVNVVVTDGAAHLWGAIESQDELDALKVILENIDGLKGVHSHIRVYPTEFLT